VKATNRNAKTIAAILIVASFCMIFVGWVDILVTNWSFFYLFKMAVEGGASTGNAVVLIILTALLAITAIWGVVAALKGKKGGPIVYLILALAALGFFLYLSGQTDTPLAAGAYLCPGLALAAVLCMCIPEK
jgi:hypothetical protein